jgi:hypothetical protein
MARIEHRSPIGRIGGERSSTLSRRVMGHLYYRRCVMDESPHALTLRSGPPLLSAPTIDSWGIRYAGEGWRLHTGLIVRARRIMRHRTIVA